VPSQSWSMLANSPASGAGQGAGSALASSTTLTDISPAPQFLSQAWGQMYVGQRWRLTAYGIFSTTGTPTLLLGFYYGGVAGTALVATAATTTGSGAASWPWEMQMLMEVRSLGSSGTVWCKGWVDFPTSLTAITRTSLPITQTQPVTINTGTNSALTCGAQWGTNSASNTITCEGFLVELLD